MNDVTTLSSVVLPEPVPPEISMFSRARTQPARSWSISSVMRAVVEQVLRAVSPAPNRRIERTGPSSASGGMIALTREPSGRRASTIGRRLVDPAPHPADDAVDDRQQVRVVPELRRNAHQLAAALDEDVVRVVDQDVRDCRVAEERLHRTEARHLPDDVLDDLVALGLGQRRRFGAQELGDREADLRRDFALVLHVLERFEVEPGDQAPVDVDLELVDGAERAVARGAREHHGDA